MSKETKLGYMFTCFFSMFAAGYFAYTDNFVLSAIFIALYGHACYELGKYS